MSKIWRGLGVCAFVAACSGGSGVSSSKKVVDLSASEAQDVCEYLADEAGPARTVDCGDGRIVEVGVDRSQIPDCVDTFTELAVSSPNCPMTVGQIEDCYEAVFALDPCGDEATPAACAPLFSSACSGSPS